MIICHVRENKPLASALMTAKRDLRAALAKIEIVLERQTALKNEVSGALSVRSGNTSGMVTLAEGHGIVVGQTFNLNWDSGAQTFCLASEVEGNNVVFAGGLQDVLPAQSTAITAVHHKKLAKEMGTVTEAGVDSPSVAHDVNNRTAALIAAIEEDIRTFENGIINYHA